MLQETTALSLTPMPVIRIDKTSLRTILGKVLKFESPTRKHINRNDMFCHSCPQGQKYYELEQTLRKLSNPDSSEIEYLKIQLKEKEKLGQTGTTAYALLKEQLHTLSYPDLSKIKELKTELERIDHMCINSNCSCCDISIEYMNERKTYGLYSSIYKSERRISKTALKLYILLYSLPQAMLGSSTHFIKDLSASKIADYLSCSISTVKRCIGILEKAGYITTCHASSYSHYNIIINSYDTMHLPAEQGGNGYITIKRDVLERILAIQNVNMLRFELLRLLRYDTARITSTTPDTLWEHYSIRDLKNMLPEHMNYQAKYEKIISDPKTLFTSYITDRKIYFKPKLDIALTVNYEEMASLCEEQLRIHLHEANLEISDKDTKDICSLSTQYDIPTILFYTESIILKYQTLKTPLKSLPALLRKICYNHALCIA